MYYDFVRIHNTLRVTPAVAAGVTDKLLEIVDIVALIEAKGSIKTNGSWSLQKTFRLVSRRGVSTIALSMLLVAFGLQALGYTGTCTQGADGPFITGAVLSSPFLLACAVLVSVNLARTLRGSSQSISALSRAADYAVAFAAVWLIYFNRDVLHSTLVLGIGPCGDSSLESPGTYDGSDMLVGFAFGFLPALVAAMVLIGILSDHWRQRISN